MHRALRLLRVIAIGAALVPCAARGDEIVFTNGDRLQGKLVKAEGGKIVFKSDSAGEVTVDMAKVRTFATDEPVKLKLTDGTVLQQQARAGEDGTMGTTGGAAADQTVPLSSIKSINFSEKWTGNFFVAGLITQGNSETQSLDLRLDLTKRSDIDRISLGGGYLYSRNENPDTGDKFTSSDNWFVLGKYDYFINEKLYAYGAVRVERDRIAELDLRLSPTAGLGYQWFDRPDFKLRTEAGLGWVFEDFTNADSNDYIAARLAYAVEKKVGDRLTLFHDLEYLPSLEDSEEFNLNADAGLRAALTERMYSELKVEWKHDSVPAPGAEKNDTRYILGVGWQF